MIQAALALAMSLAATAVLAAPQATGSSAVPQLAMADQVLGDQVLTEVNRFRAARQLLPLQPDPALAALAGEHSARMAQHGQLTHDGFPRRFERARRQTCVENLAAGYRQADRLVAGWATSGSHLQNLLDARVTEAGVASVAGHVTWLACSGPGPGR